MRIRTVTTEPTGVGISYKLDIRYKIILSHVSVTIDGILIGEKIY
jgi:hypothetical protein